MSMSISWNVPHQPGMVFLPLMKADAVTRTFTARAALEEVDKSREIMDYATARPQFEKWSKQFADATLGKSLGNIRAMHNPRHLAGKVENIVYDDDAKTIDVMCKVLDPTDWIKVEEGGYTGLSIGGGYENRWPCPLNKGVTRYTPRLSEISLVDSPCMHGALIMQLHKRDGALVDVALHGVPRSFAQLLAPRTFDEMQKGLGAAIGAGLGTGAVFGAGLGLASGRKPAKKHSVLGHVAYGLLAGGAPYAGYRAGRALVAHSQAAKQEILGNLEKNLWDRGVGVGERAGRKIYRAAAAAHIGANLERHAARAKKLDPKRPMAAAWEMARKKIRSAGDIGAGHGRIAARIAMPVAALEAVAAPTRHILNERRKRSAAKQEILGNLAELAKISLFRSPEQKAKAKQRQKESAKRSLIGIAIGTPIGTGYAGYKATRYEMNLPAKAKAYRAMVARAKAEKFRTHVHDAMAHINPRFAEHGLELSHSSQYGPPTMHADERAALAHRRMALAHLRYEAIPKLRQGLKLRGPRNVALWSLAGGGAGAYGGSLGGAIADGAIQTGKAVKRGVRYVEGKLGKIEGNASAAAKQEILGNLAELAKIISPGQKAAAALALPSILPSVTTNPFDSVGGYTKRKSAATRARKAALAPPTPPPAPPPGPPMGKAEDSDVRARIHETMHAFKHGKLHSFRGENPKTGKPRKGPKVMDRRQAIAIALNQAGRIGKSADSAIVAALAGRMMKAAPSQEPSAGWITPGDKQSRRRIKLKTGEMIAFPDTLQDEAAISEKMIHSPDALAQWQKIRAARKARAAKVDASVGKQASEDALQKIGALSQREHDERIAAAKARWHHEDQWTGHGDHHDAAIKAARKSIFLRDHKIGAAQFAHDAHWHSVADSMEAYDKLRPHIAPHHNLMIEGDHALYNPEGVGGEGKEDPHYIVHPSEVDTVIAHFRAAAA